MGLFLNTRKTKYMIFNSNTTTPLKTTVSSELNRVADFKYLGSWVSDTEKDVKCRIALAWKALNSMKNIWSSQMSQSLKVKFFTATVESVLLYGCESWTLASRLEKRLDGCYTRMLRSVKQIHWERHVTNLELYGGLPRVSTKIRARRLRLAGHCLRHAELAASKLVL